MKAAIVDGKGNLTVKSVPDAKINSKQALVKMLACSICNGTDSKIVDGQLYFVDPKSYPAILGHESVGRVIEVGKECTKFKVGDVVLRPTSNSEGYGWLWGGFAELGVLSEDNAMQQLVPASIDPVEATMLITLKECLSSLRGLHAREGSSLLVTGTGPVAMGFVKFAPFAGFKNVVAAGRRPEGLKALAAMGAEKVFNIEDVEFVDQIRGHFKNKGVDYAVDTTDTYTVVEKAGKALASGGRVGVYGIAPTDVRRPMPTAPQHRAIARLDPNEPSVHDEMLKLVAEGKVRLKDFISEVMPLERIGEGLEKIRDRRASKVVTTM